MKTYILFFAMFFFNLGVYSQTLENFENGNQTWNNFNGTFANIVNPNPSGENTSARSGRFIKENAPFAFLTTSIPGGFLDLNTFNELQIKILQQINGGNDAFTRIVAKLENSATGQALERRGFISNSGVWTTYAFDFSNAPTGAGYDTLVLFFGFNEAANTNSFFFDDITFNRARGYSVDNNRSLGQLGRNSYEVFRSLRLSNGTYRDSKLLNSNDDYHPGSTASVGMGLVSLCIAHKNNYDTDAIGKLIKTLETMTGRTAGFTLDRDASGFARHFFDLSTGARAWDSEYSTIDTAILVSGALFAKNYFLDPSIANRPSAQQRDYIAQMADEMVNGVNWDRSIASAGAGTIYRETNASGFGIAGSETNAFNEYMIVANIANQFGGQVSKDLWNNFYTNTNNLPTATAVYTNPNNATFQHTTLTDSPGRFLPSFIVQFNYFLINGFSTNTPFINAMRDAKNADKNWWRFVSEDFYANPIPRLSYEWGTGAGDANDINGYRANSIYNDDEENWTKIVSPHIISGYLPIDEGNEIGNDLVNLFRSGRGIYRLPNSSGTRILWRYSKEDVNWRANAVQGVDFATMLFGLQYRLDPSFFTKYNDYDTVIGGGNQNNITTTIRARTINRYVSSENGVNPMIANRTVVGTWETFEFVPRGGNTYAIRGNNGRYVSIQNTENQLTCNRTSIGSTEEFTLVSLGGDLYGIQGSNGRYVSHERGNRSMRCNRTALRSWEEFIIPGLGSNKTSGVTLLNSLKVFPNPVSSANLADLKMEISLESPSESFIKIYDLTGKIIFKEDLGMMDSGRNTVSLKNLETSRLNNGLYIISFQTQDYQKNEKLIVTK
ncbi:T9SS type A sorting domain-containing protein [Aquimarina sp. SS2-1]|uniref:T9SS type A sorting domain-containing protein n=1 Tax=Aquimarina besae TaxID=3342247 RepID=UPI00366BAA7E